MASLGNDLANIRKEKHLTLNDINEETRIPKHILNAIEDDSIFARIGKDTTYIRGYVLSYGKALSVDKEKIRQTLDQVEAGTYTGMLALEDEETKPEDKEMDTEADHESEKKEGDKSEEDKTKESPGMQSYQAFPPPPPSKDIEKPSISSIDWAHMDHGAKSSTRPRRWITGIAILIILGIILLVYFLWGNNSTIGSNNNTPAVIDTTSVADHSPDLGVGATVQRNTMDAVTSQMDSSTVNRGRANLSLPDTLTFTINAARGKLNPVHIYTDLTNKTNPYWIEKGSSRSYQFKNNFRIRGDLQNMVLTVNGHRLQHFREKFLNPQTSQLEISRSYLQSHAAWQNEPADSLQ